MYDDTIAAISTAIGESGIGIVRISGKDAMAILGRVFMPGDTARRSGGVFAMDRSARFLSSLESHRVYYGHAVDPSTNAVIDEVLAIWMRAPRSYTREDVVELHCHGGPTPLQRLLGAVLRAGARPAMPGEFTMRAFLNGRIDLAQAEAVADVIRAKTERGLALAMKGLSGELSGRVRAIRQDLLRVLAYLEATIDFTEDDIPEEDVRGPLEAALKAVGQLLAVADQGIICRHGVRAAIVGRPNVGKSSLLNALLRTDRAIVTEIAGTTRDTLEEVANLSGIPVCLIDTAGIVETDDLVERLGVERSRRALEEADLRLLVVDTSVPLQREDREIAASLRGKPTVVVANKADLPSVVSRDDLTGLVENATVVVTSARSGRGLDELREAILQVVFSGRAFQSDELLVSNPRHKWVLERVESHLTDAIASLDSGLPVDCTASDLRLALEALGEITGETATEELIETIFSHFCVGK